MANSEKLEMLVREGEGLTVEFKEHFTSRIDEDIVAFANTLLVAAPDFAPIESYLSGRCCRLRR